MTAPTKKMSKETPENILTVNINKNLNPQINLIFETEWNKYSAITV